jgi:hypothetical protein
VTGLVVLDREGSGESLEFRRRTIVTLNSWETCMLLDRQWKGQQGNQITKVASLPRY